uniref:Uncharacterized protein n=1 Tax=Globisporangium ultimum (strain ATCC 200006 / CBS 805.95 / DAOM BR144) TaxID=431595 RepID=K3X574_GLOUD
MVTSTMAPVDKHDTMTEVLDLTKPTSDLEVRLLHAFSEFALDRLVYSYRYVKHSSRLATLVVSTTERILTRTGLVALVKMLFAQFQRMGHPWLQYVDEAMGDRIIDVFVGILLLAKEHERESTEREKTLALFDGDLEKGALSTSVSSALGRLSYHERIHALLHGELPRADALLEAFERRAFEAQQQAQASINAAAEARVVMELKDFVPVDEVKRMKETNKALVNEKTQEVAALRAQISALEREKQRLEQDLTDVHNYQESERGQRFVDMEEELARTKLEANQRAHDLRKLELVVEVLRRKRKSKGTKSEAGKSTTTSEGPPSPQNRATTV